MRHLLVLATALGLFSGCAAPVGDPSAEGDVGAAASAVHGPDVGEGTLLASFGAPGFPEGVVVHDDRFFVAGPANFEQTTALVRAYDRRTGALLETIPVTHPGADPTDALSCITTDARGRLYVLSEALGVVRLTPHAHGWQQEIYAPLPADGLPGCTHAAQFLTPDASDPLGRAACHLLNDLAFDADGRLFVTDSARATIYRVDAGGGSLHPWFVSPLLLGGPPFPIGANGIRVSPGGDEIWFTVTTSPLPALAGRGALYKLPNKHAPQPGDLTAVHYFDPGLGPDGIAFGESGDVYTPLAFASQISVVDPGGVEIARLTGPQGSAVPYDSPANIAFDGHGSMLVDNHALLSGISGDMGILRVFAGDRGTPLFRPGGD